MHKSELIAFLPLIMRERDYLEISTPQANVIRSIDNHESLVHIESESGTVNWKSEILPDCRLGYFRLWTRQDWEITSNVRNRLRAQADKERIIATQRADLTEHRKQLIITHFTKTLPREIVSAVIIGKNADEEKINTLWEGLVATGVKLE